MNETINKLYKTYKTMEYLLQNREKAFCFNC